jgi:energy-coupling factor transporter transmembrane protein EcfT
VKDATLDCVEKAWQKGGDDSQLQVASIVIVMVIVIVIVIVTAASIDLFVALQRYGYPRSRFLIVLLEGGDASSFTGVIMI